MSSIAIIDYGMGNLHSVAKAFEHVAPDAQIRVTSNAAEILSADRVVLPGVGAIRDCMAEIRRLGVDVLVKQVAAEKPLLGICVGMQAMLQRSEENGGVDCIGLFAGEVKRFADGVVEGGQRLKVPHMGWNRVQHRVEHPIWQGIPDGERFYFVHSYYVPAAQPEMIGQTDYGVPFAAVLAHDNVVAVQFHPEKSQHAGLQLLKNFASWNGRF